MRRRRRSLWSTILLWRRTWPTASSSTRARPPKRPSPGSHRACSLVIGSAVVLVHLLAKFHAACIAAAAWAVVMLVPHFKFLVLLYSQVALACFPVATNVLVSSDLTAFSWCTYAVRFSPAYCSHMLGGLCTVQMFLACFRCIEHLFGRFGGHLIIP